MEGAPGRGVRRLFTRWRGKRSWSCDSVRFGRSRATTGHQRRAATATDGRQSQRSFCAADRSSLRRREPRSASRGSGSSPGSRGRHRMHGCSSLTIRVCTCQPDASSELDRRQRRSGPVTRWAAWSCCRRVAQRSRAHGCWRLTEAEFRRRRVVMILVNSRGSLRADRGALDRNRFALKPGERWRF